MGGFAGAHKTCGRPCQSARNNLVAATASEADAQTNAGTTARLGVWRGRWVSHGQWQVCAAARPQLSSLVDGGGPGTGGFDPELVLGLGSEPRGDRSPDLYQPRWL